VIGDVLERLGVPGATARAVGGRANRHWVVTSGGERQVLCRFAAERSLRSVEYQLEVAARMRAAGWPTPDPVAEPIVAGGCVWSLLRYLPGRRPLPRGDDAVRREERRRGRLLARLHADLQALPCVQRDDWRETLRIFDGSLDAVFRGRWPQLSAEIAFLRAETAATGTLLQRLAPSAPPPIVIHGDVVPWNLRFRRGQLTGILDWEFAHLDQRVADFALAWRGRHHEVVRGYEDESPLDDVERALIEPVRRAWLLDGARRVLERHADEGVPDLSWTIRQLRRRPVL
jgi:Ser/Thr protein kinase RdoA (MazF antagonist)